ncbi:TIGR02234 family membrane protein [Streptomyces sp. ACA25]|uniref:TIGR02234 family membrane protein n=1 Tax=Streptomyces sp. ACA25 TaxID=3022596 RepID=UPI00230726F2|nr:TIGR02234 family membrane protein [Streptomyces sp. ACA25]MDB1088623.1 TIGR02234 family membrane protein [Streptomyces sp. ACA25]
MTREPSSRSPRASRRALGLALLCGAFGAAAVLIAAGQTWAEGTATATGGELRVTADGSAVSGLPSALALVGLAALVAVFAVRRTGRRVVAAVLALSGAGILAAALRDLGDTAALEHRAAEATGLASAAVTGVSHTGWPWVSALGGVLLLCAGLLALVYGRHWPAMSSRYERAERRAPRGGSDPDKPEDLWKALDRGEDPT